MVHCNNLYVLRRHTHAQHSLWPTWYKYIYRMSKCMPRQYIKLLIQCIHVLAHCEMNAVCVCKYIRRRANKNQCHWAPYCVWISNIDSAVEEHRYKEELKSSDHCTACGACILNTVNRGDFGHPKKKDTCTCSLLYTL